MSLKIRLARGGSKKRPYYRIVVADSRSPRDGRFIEKIGFWNPMLPKDSPERVGFDADRVKHWIGVGAKPTDRVARFLNSQGLYEWKPGNNPNKGKPGEKALERLEAKNAPKEEAAEASGEAEAPADEAPAEEAAGEEAAEG